MVASTFLRQVEDACEQALVAVGFKRLRRLGLVWEISPAFLGWLGLNHGKHDSFVRINPFVGVHATDVMKIYSALKGNAYKKGEIATYAIHLGEIVPKELAFEFYEGNDLTIEATRLAKTLVTSAVPYMNSIASYDALLPLIKKEVPTLGGHPEVYATILYLSGRPEMARNFITGLLGREGEWENIPIESCVKFGEEFLRYIAENK